MGSQDKISQKCFSFLILLFLFIILVLSLTLDISTVAAWSAPREPVKIPPIIIVTSPHQGTYTTSNVTLNFSVDAPASWYREGRPDEYFKNITYRVDANLPKLIWTTGQVNSNITPGEFTYNIFGLGNGLHTIIIDVTISSPYDIFSPGDPHGHFGNTEIWNSNKTISFTIKTPETAPSPAGLTLYSPLNMTYSSSIVVCNGTFVCPKGFQSSLNYSIDGKYMDGLPWKLDPNSIFDPDIYIINGSFLLPQLSNGSHQLSIGVLEELLDNSNINSPRLINSTSWINTIYFSISSSQPTNPTPTVPEFSILVILPLLVGMLFVALMLRHRKLQAN